MAKPTISDAVFSSVSKSLVVLFDQAVTYAGAKAGIVVTDENNAVWINTGAPASGNGTTTLTWTLVADSTGAPVGTTSYMTMAAAFVQNGGAETINAVNDGDRAVRVGIYHQLPFSRTDLNNLYTKLQAMFSFPTQSPNTTFGSSIASADVGSLNALLLAPNTALLKSPGLDAACWDFSDALEKYRQSNQTKSDFDALMRAWTDVAARLQKRGTLVRTSEGL